MFLFLRCPQVLLRASIRQTKTLTLLSSLAGGCFLFFLFFLFSVYFLSTYALFCCSGILTVSALQMGDVGERPPGPRMADAAGKEAPLHASSCQLQAFPDHGDQPQGKQRHL